MLYQLIEQLYLFIAQSEFNYYFTFFDHIIVPKYKIIKHNLNSNLNKSFKLFIVQQITINFFKHNSQQMQAQDKTVLAKCPQLEVGSDEWKQIEFKLQLSLGTASSVIKRIYDISNPHVAASFSNFSKGRTVLESFISTEKLNQPTNKLSKVIQKGYEVQEDGMIFAVGYNQVGSSGSAFRAQNEFSFILNKVAVGKSYCCPIKKFMNQVVPLPQGFESIYLYNEQQNIKLYKHQYVVYKNYQVLPMYLVDFTIDSHKELITKTPYCQNCVKMPPELAKLYCITQEAYFCPQCDMDYHSSKLASQHQRVPISQKPKVFGKCEKHDKQDLQLYCSVCSQALCINCKIFGDHMTGEMAEHALIKLKDAYSQISSKVKEIDPNIERRKNQLTEDLSKIDLKIKEVNSKATHVEEQIYALFKKVLNQLQVETQRKLSYLIGDQLELKRQYDHILWMDSFIKHQLDLQEPHDFLHSWYKFSKYKKEVLSLTNLSINTEVKADMMLDGEIRIITQGGLKARKQEKIKSFDQSSMMSPMEMMLTTPVKESNKKDQKNQYLGSTSLRKTVFKNHYAEKIKEMGTEPSTVKGGGQTSNNIGGGGPR